SMDALLASLNESQRRAVTAPPGPLMIVAGAGTGKTTTLTHRIAYLITHTSARPENVLAITFTIRAAEQMRERLQTLGIGSERLDAVWIGTIHALCHEILSRFGQCIGRSNGMIIISQPDRTTLIKTLLKDPLFPDSTLTPREFEHLITIEKGNGLSDEQMSPPCQYYQTRLNERGFCDYDDLIRDTIRLLKHAPDVRTLLQQRFIHIFVDEYQDINQAQYELLRLLCGEKANLCVVGDADQAIYAFRGAQLKIFLSFQHDFPQATVIRLQENYRSTATIIKAASAVVHHNRERMDMTLIPTQPDGHAIELLDVPSDGEEARIICRHIEKLIGGTRFETLPTQTDPGRSYGLGDIAVLYRVHQQNRLIKKALEERGIPVEVAKTRSFYDEPPVATVVQALEVVRYPERDHAMSALLAHKTFGLSLADRENLMTCVGEKGESLFDALQHGMYLQKISRAGTERLINLINLLRMVRTALTTQTIDTITQMLWRVLNPEDEDLLPELITCVMPFTHINADSGIPLFLEKIAMLREGDFAGPQREAVTLMTVHMAKGLEFPVVFLTGLDMGLFPFTSEDGLKMDIEEERRLFYVGMTRAREKLYITTSRSRLLFGKRHQMEPSVFLMEIPPSYLKKTYVTAPRKKEKPRQMKLFG
ncbi:MAG: ATP-dependent helicase, partial [Desulfobacterota bacterium]|nr:ATP-dependent helicase [Thermodesulfobacteriota bacterium]